MYIDVVVLFEWISVQHYSYAQRLTLWLEVFEYDINWNVCTLFLFL